MKTISLSIVVLFALNACIGGSFGVNHVENKNKFIERHVAREKLSNGGVLMVGYKEPKADNACTNVYTENKDWNEAQFSGMINFGGAYGVFSDAAIAYVNAHPDAGINYAYLDIPNTKSYEFSGFSVPSRGNAQAHIMYYACKNPPERHLNPFSDN
jgi:hypothetical protein